MVDVLQKMEPPVGVLELVANGGKETQNGLCSISIPCASN